MTNYCSLKSMMPPERFVHGHILCEVWIIRNPKLMYYSLIKRKKMKNLLKMFSLRLNKIKFDNTRSYELILLKSNMRAKTRFVVLPFSYC